MPSKPHIKISDDPGLRLEIEHLNEQTCQSCLVIWAVRCAKHVLSLAKPEYTFLITIEDGFKTIELWQSGKASVHDIRQAGFRIHEAARQCGSEVMKNALRTSGHAVGVAHMKEHAIVCSDYAVKTLQLAFPGQMDKISEERLWQLNELKRIVRQND